MPNFKPLASMVWEEIEVTDGWKDGQQFLSQSIMASLRRDKSLIIAISYQIFYLFSGRLCHTLVESMPFAN